MHLGRKATLGTGAEVCRVSRCRDKPSELQSTPQEHGVPGGGEGLIEVQRMKGGSTWGLL